LFPGPEDFERRLAAGLGRRPAGAVFLAALSGGADSTAMTAGLAALRDAARLDAARSDTPAAAFSFHCLHVNHNIRDPEECAADEDAVRELCRRLSVPLRVCRAPPGLIRARARGRGLEAAARLFRHAALRGEARRTGAQAILVAHTQNDLLETILMAVLRGAGPAGLGVWRRAGGNTGPVPVIRPLAGFSREEVIAYLRARGFSWREDPSNADTRFLRSRVRRRLIPLLDSEFPHWRGPLLRLNETQALTANFLAAEARRALRWEACGGALSVNAADFFAQSPVIREEALFAALDDLGAARPRRAALEAFVRGEQRARDLGGLRLENREGRVSVMPRTAGGCGFSVLIKSFGGYKLEGHGLVLTVNAEGGNFRVFLPFTLRTARGGGVYGGGACIEARDRAGQAALFDTRGKLLRKRKDQGAAAVRLEFD
jgi:tRNA(Ile)-lysidine synthase